MKSRWNEADAARCGNELALRAYSSRLLGSDGSLVLHGGGNTSLKQDENGTRVLYVKGTGCDLAQVDERAFAPLLLHQVTPLLAQDRLDYDGMMRALDHCLVRRPAPRPSIETLMHAGLPFRYVEHTHADSVLAAMNVDTIEAVHAEVYGSRAPLVPYHHSGPALARACVETLRTQGTANTIGLILAFHGVVAFADDARMAYERMIELVTRAEDYLKARGAWDVLPQAPALVHDTQGLDALHRAVDAIAGVSLARHCEPDPRHVAFARRSDIGLITQSGPATPQHAVYTKRIPLVGRDVAAYAARYREYLERHLGPAAGARIDAAPRIVLDAQFGLCAFGETERDAHIAAEMFGHDVIIISRASAHGRYRSAPPAAIAQAEFEYGGYGKKS